MSLLRAERDLALRRAADVEDANERLRGALNAMVYVHPCHCGDGIPAGACSRCRAVALLGYDPAVMA